MGYAGAGARRVRLPNRPRVSPRGVPTSVQLVPARPMGYGAGGCSARSVTEPSSRIAPRGPA